MKRFHDRSTQLLLFLALLLPGSYCRPSCTTAKRFRPAARVARGAAPQLPDALLGRPDAGRPVASPADKPKGAPLQRRFQLRRRHAARADPRHRCTWVARTGRASSIEAGTREYVERKLMLMGIADPARSGVENAQARAGDIGCCQPSTCFDMHHPARENDEQTGGTTHEAQQDQADVA